MVAGTALPTSALGILWFGVNGGLWLRPPGRLHLAWAAIGLLAVVGLVFIEIDLLGAICLWCTVAHALVVVLVLIAVTARS